MGDGRCFARPVENKYPYTGAMTLFARGIGAARNGDPTAARDIARLAGIAAALKAAKNDYWATRLTSSVSALLRGLHLRKASATRRLG